MGREPGAGVMRGLEGMFTAQNVTITLWAACVFPPFRSPAEGIRWVRECVLFIGTQFNNNSVTSTPQWIRQPEAAWFTVARRLVSLDKPGRSNTAQLCQLHQFFVWCGVEPTLGVEAINDMQSLKEACRSAFEGTKTAPSATKQQVSETLC
jgi:hypothetical protein